MKFFTILFIFIASLSISAQEEALFNKLDFNSERLKLVKDFHLKKKEQKALEALLALYREKENLYLKVSDTDAKYIKANYPKEVAKTLKTADEVLKHDFIFQDDWDMEKTNIPYQFTGEIDWKAIPFGDEEWCFMLNRHKFWIDLGKAYLLTGNEKYAKGFVDQVTHWIDNNPLTDDLKNISWRRIEAGIRCENWIKAFEYIKHSKQVTPKFLSKFLTSLYQHGEYLNSTFSGFSQTSNWDVLEFQGVFNLAFFLDEFKIAAQWQHKAIKRLSTCIKLQILKDGSQWEQSPMYHNEVFHCFMNVNLLAQRQNIKLPEILIQKTKDMAYANVKWQKPNFHQPLLGDSDDTDLRGLLTLAALVFNDVVLKSRAFERLDYETLFLTGKKGKEAYKSMDAKNPEFLSVYQQNSGDFYMRTSWEENAIYVGFHMKKLGGGHGHDNLLHFTLFANGQDYLIDGGRYTYVNNEWREFFKNSKKHNTLGVDHLTNSVYKDSWSNSYDARSNDTFTKSTKDFDYAEAQNMAYNRLEDPVSMKRRFLFLKPNIWLVFDTFSAKKEHTYSQYFNFLNNNVTIDDGGLATTFPKNNLRIQPIKEAKIKLTDSWWSPEYNLKHENKRAEIYKTAVGFTSFLSLLYFPDQVDVTYKKVPVYNRNDDLLSDREVEAVNLYLRDTTYTFLVSYDLPLHANHFFKVNGEIVSSGVVLIKKSKEDMKIYIIK